EIAERKADHRIDGPGMNAPGEEGDAHRLTLGRRRHRFSNRRRHEMGDRLAHGEIHEADAQAGCKQHRDPGYVAEIRFRIVRTELQVTVAAEAENDHREQEDADREKVEPAEIRQYSRLETGEDRLR